MSPQWWFWPRRPAMSAEAMAAGAGIGGGFCQLDPVPVPVPESARQPRRGRGDFFSAARLVDPPGGGEGRIRTIGWLLDGRDLARGRGGWTAGISDTWGARAGWPVGPGRQRDVKRVDRNAGLRGNFELHGSLVARTNCFRASYVHESSEANSPCIGFFFFFRLFILHCFWTSVHAFEVWDAAAFYYVLIREDTGSKCCAPSLAMRPPCWIAFESMPLYA